MVFHHHRPLTTIYRDNYRYGTSLYTPEMDDAERRYRTTLSKTPVRSDRGDLGLYSFVGSHIHGGIPASEKVLAPKVKGSTTPNLYASLGDRPYGRGYYDHLRATSPEPRIKTTKPSTLLDDPTDLYAPRGETPYGRGYYDHLRAISPERKRRNIKSSALLDDAEYTLLSRDTEYKTLPTRFSDFDNNLKTTTKTTTTKETWVPLTTYIYNTPYHTYYYKATPYSSYTYRTADDLYSYDYLDDYKRYATTSTKTTKRTVDASDYSMTSKFDYSSYVDKCSKIQSQLDEVNRWVSDAETKIKSEVVTSRNKLQTELAEVAMIVEDTAKYNEELHSAIRKQTKKISTLSSQYEDINRNIGDILDTLDKSRARCQTLQSDLSSLQSMFEMTKSYPETTKKYTYTTTFPVETMKTYTFTYPETKTYTSYEVVSA